MHAFIWVMIISLGLESFLMVVNLMKRDYQRKPSAMVISVGISMVMIAWGAWLLGGA